MDDIKQQLDQVLQRIRQAEHDFNRTANSVHLLAVSKTKPVEAILAAADAGQIDFGENYIQEACEKIDTIQQMGNHPLLRWHFIGSIQSNKTRDIANRFHWVHSIDRFKIAKRLSEQRDESLPALNVCIQVNISGETSKSGAHPEAVAELAQQIATLPRIKLRGLMAIPATITDFEQQRHIFHRVQELQQQLIHTGLPLDTLSMGMSDDLEAAIAEGATIVRIGTAVFGERDYGKT